MTILAPDDQWHGTNGGYTNHACRCDRCRNAARLYAEARRRRLGVRPRREMLDERIAEADARDNHGTETRYGRGCRCDTCKAGVAAARRRRRNDNLEASLAYEREYRRRGASA